MAASIFYIIAYAALCAAIFGFPKKSVEPGESTGGAPKKQNAFLWLVLALFLAECWANVVAGLLSLLHIPVTLLSIGISHFVAAGLLYWLARRKSGSGALKCSHSEIRVADAAMGVLLLALIVVLGYVRFYTANPIIFATIDPAERLGNAMNIAIQQSVITHFPNQYFIQLTGSLFIQTLQPFAPGVLPFRFFEWKDLFNLWFTGALFYGAVSLYMRSRFSKVLSFILTFVFLLGYPWMNQLFGFVYPGVATNLILLVLIAFALLFRGELDKKPAYIIASIGCFGIGICYTLYAPPLFIAAFLAILFYEHKYEKSRLGHIALTELAVFIIPAAWTFVNSVMLDFSGQFNVGNSIMDEGAINRNLYTDFIPYAPLVFWFIWRLVTKRRLEFPLIFTLCFAVYQIAIFALMMTSHVSTYYYYKLYFATWLIFLFLACLAIDALAKHAQVRRFIAVYLICWGLLATLGVSGMDYRFEAHRTNSNPQPGADVSFRVYATNLLYFSPPGTYNVINYGWDFIDLCTEARRLAGPVDENKRIQIVTENMKDTFWKDALTSQLLIPHTGKPDSTSGLWIVLKDSSVYKTDKAFYDGMDKLFENDLGFIVDPS